MDTRKEVYAEEWLKTHNDRLRLHPRYREDMVFTQVSSTYALVFRTRDQEISDADRQVLEEVVGQVAKTHRVVIPWRQAGQAAEKTMKPRLTSGIAVGLLVGYVIAFLAFGLAVVGRSRLHDAANLGSAFGVFNAFVAGLALFGVIAAIVLQKQELELQREEIRLNRQELARSADAQHESQKALARLSHVWGPDGYVFPLNAGASRHS